MTGFQCICDLPRSDMSYQVRITTFGKIAVHSKHNPIELLCTCLFCKQCMSNMQRWACPQHAQAYRPPCDHTHEIHTLDTEASGQHRRMKWTLTDCLDRASRLIQPFDAFFVVILQHPRKHMMSVLACTPKLGGIKDQQQWSP